MRIEPPAPPPEGEATSSADGGNPPVAAALVSLSDVERSRRESVLAYCSRLCDPDRIGEAVDAAFAEFRTVLESADGHAALDVDRVLLEATRSAAADRSDASAALPGFAGLSLRRSSTCELMPRLLAARASELLGSADLDRVDRHLSRCAACRELERRRVEAERAYDLLRAEPPAGAAEPFASPGDEAPEIAATGFAPTAPDAEPEPEAEAPVGDDAHDGGASMPTATDAEAESSEGDAELPEPDVSEPDAAYAPDPETREHASFAPAAARDDADATSTGDFSFELADPEPLDDDRTTDDEPEPAGARAAGLAAAAPAPHRSAWRKWGAVVGPLVAAAVAIAIIAAVDEDEDERPRPAASQNAAEPEDEPDTEAAAPSRPERRTGAARTRARLDALGDRLLGPGMRGSDVKALQRLLGVPQTGEYGPLTQYAVGEFQAQHDLPVDGQAGARTKRLLARRPRPPKNPPTLPPAGSGVPGAPPAPGGQSPAEPAPEPPAAPPGGAPPAGQTPGAAPAPSP